MVGFAVFFIVYVNKNIFKTAHLSFLSPALQVYSHLIYCLDRKSLEI
jgi:hypothetical protein